MAKWEEEVKDHYENILKKNNLEKVDFSWSTFRAVSSIIACASGILAIICFFCLKFHYIIFGISGLTLLSICVILVVILRITKGPDLSEAEKLIINSLDFPYYYALAVKDLSHAKYQLSSLSTEFDIAPVNFVPEKGTNKTDGVLNFFCNDINYSYGTITNEILHLLPSIKKVITKTTTYNRYSYLNLRLRQSLNLKATIQPAKSFLNLFKTPDNTDLESLEFEKIYSVEADDQINIRKLLKPNLQEKLVELAYANENIAKIGIVNDTITFAFNSFSVLDWDDSERKIGKTFEYVLTNMVQAICDKIKEDITSVFYALIWVEKFDFFKE